jgi:hypothetical protein
MCRFVCSRRLPQSNSFREENRMHAYRQPYRRTTSETAYPPTHDGVQHLTNKWVVGVTVSLFDGCIAPRQWIHRRPQHNSSEWPADICLSNEPAPRFARSRPLSTLTASPLLPSDCKHGWPLNFYFVRFKLHRMMNSDSVMKRLLPSNVEKLTWSESGWKMRSNAFGSCKKKLSTATFQR